MFESIFASFKTILLTTTAWPSALSKTTGLLGAKESISHLVGNLFSGQVLSIHPLPIIQSLGFFKDR